MNREQLAHVLRAASSLTGDPDIVVIGSQSILATYDEHTLPSEATLSMEATSRFESIPTTRKPMKSTAKLVAGRQKDLQFATALLRAGLVDGRVLLERCELLPGPGAVVTRVRSSVERRIAEAKRG
ncbi:MAG TPA: hypothetical protein VGI86_06565 [Acidimicrobiia bacterium]